MAYLGTPIIIGMIVCGYLNVTLWVVLPGAVAAAFIAANYPPGKAETAKARGFYWKFIIAVVPLQAVFVAIFYGVGWGARLLFD